MFAPLEREVIECARAAQAAQCALDQSLWKARQAGISWRKLAALAACPQTTVRRHVKAYEERNPI